MLVKRPGPAFGRAFDDPAHGFLRPVDLEAARREHDGLRRDPRSTRGRPSIGLEDETDDPGPRLHVRPAARRRARRDPAPARQAEPRGRAGDRSRRGPAPRGSRRSAGSRRRGRSRAATRSGFGRTCCASGERSGRTTPARASWRRSSAATCGSSTCRTGAARPSSSISCRSSRRSPTISRSSSCRSCRSGCGSCSRELGRAARRGARGGVPDARLQRPGGPAGGRDRGRGQSDVTRRALEAAGCEVHAIPLRRGRRERFGRPDVPDPADPARMTRRGGRHRSSTRIEARPPDARSGSPRSPGREEAVQDRDRAAVHRDRAGRRRGSSPIPRRSPRTRTVPGAEMPRTSLPVVIGRIGRPGGRRLLLVGHVDVVPPGDPATWTADPWGGEIRDGATVRPRGVRHEGRRRRRSSRRCGRSSARASRIALDGEVLARLRPVRGGRRPGHARRDPGRAAPATPR